MIAALLLASIGGCGLPDPPSVELAYTGCIFYLDGAGGGCWMVDWGREVNDGLRRFGYAGQFHNFRWQTGLGPWADQVASVSYKRSKAAELAGRIATHASDHPQCPVSLIGFSAGAAVAVYALEELPSACAVDSAVLVAPSMSAYYDLSTALRHVRGQTYVLISNRDAVLQRLVPWVGTADRMPLGDCVAGVDGFKRRDGADYATVKTIPWQPEFEQFGNFGGHTDAVRAAFVSAHVAPLLMGDGVASAHAAARTVATDRLAMTAR
ncbi:MAG: hypothetical protein ACE5EX_02685 [Phycisphaerae bacterium]